MDLLDGYNIHHKTEEVLQGLGFSNAHLQMTLSGIQRRLAYACIARENDTQKPDLLLLDEPTNHLTFLPLNGLKNI
jgi:ATP-binding cassette subfamily F protein 3